MKIAALEAKSHCYLSTPEHIRRPFWHWSIYTDKGELELSGASLSFSGKKGGSFQIPLADIESVRIGSFPRAAKPFGLDYIELSFANGSLNGTVLLTPATSWATPTWETNKNVAKWHDLIQLAIAESAQ